MDIRRNIKCCASLSFLISLGESGIVSSFTPRPIVNVRSPEHPSVSSQLHVSMINPFARKQPTKPKDENPPLGLAAQIAKVFGGRLPLQETTKDFNHGLVKTLKEFLFDTLFREHTVDRAFARFYALETIARMPYFSYLSVLHLMETMGHWRQADLLKVHFAEEWNELHHLLIMEELGGNKLWLDRFVAQHIAFFYYWIVAVLYCANPGLAYNLNQNVEEEAYHTYDQFLRTHGDYLRTQPAPDVAVRYYSQEPMFDAMHTGAGASELEPVERRRPVMNTLYDTFTAIRDDEWEHAKTMAHLQHTVEEETVSSSVYGQQEEECILGTESLCFE